MTVNHKAYQLGWEDGYTMATESGSADPGVEGWDGLLINAIGPTQAGEILNEEPGSKGFWEAMAEYTRGAQDGAATAIAEQGDRP